MRHQWDEGDTLLGTIVSECKVCGGFRTRSRYPGVDFASGNGFHMDMVGKSRKGWKYDDGTPRSCPGEKIDWEAYWNAQEEQGGDELG